jgi:hypothetical protein
VARAAGNSLIIAAASLTRSLSLTLVNASAPGTFSLAYTTSATTIPSFAILTTGGSSWTTNTTGGTGSVVLTVLTSSRVAGTFSFDATPSPGQGTTTAHVTGGTFDVTY